MIEETDDYWIRDKSLIFKPNFNKPLDEFNSIITQCESLIFANHNKLADIERYNNTARYRYHGSYKSSDFNRPIVLKTNIKKLIVGDKFNKPVELVETLEELHFGESFNQPIVFNNGLKKLTLGEEFAQNVNLPSNLIYLGLKCNNSCILNNLPNGIEDLELCVDIPLDNLPTGIKKIKLFNNNYPFELNNLPNTIELLKIPNNYKLKIKHYPNLKIFISNILYPYIHNYKNNDDIIVITNDYFP